MTVIKQFGLQRSGTNIVRALLQINFEDVVVLQNFLGDKHTAISWEIMERNLRDQVPDEFGISDTVRQEISMNLTSRNLYFVFNIKDPITWINSYYKYQKLKFEHRNPGLELSFDLDFAHRVLPRWAENVKSWLNFYLSNEDRCVVFQHETVLLGPSALLTQAKEKFGLIVAGDSIVDLLSGYALRGTDLHYGKELINEKVSFDRDYHLKGGWKRDIPSDILSFSQSFMREFFDREPHLKHLFNLDHLDGMSEPIPTRDSHA